MNCLKCDSENKDDAIFCKKCGTNLKDKETQKRSSFAK